MQHQSLNGSWQFQQDGAEEWLPAAVPGSVFTDLLALDRIPDPFVGDNEKDVMWVPEKSWVYRLTFTPDPELLAEDRVELICDGLDTLASLTLNGQPLGSTGNMFRVYRWAVGDILKPGENELIVHFDSAVEYTTERDAQRPLRTVDQPIPGSPHIRKAPYMYGWDWGPVLPPVGIWRDIRLEAHSSARLVDVHLRQSHTDQAVTVSAAAIVDAWHDDPLAVELHITAPDGSEQVTRVDAAGGRVAARIEIADPELWWPNGYGDQPLYRVKVSLFSGDQLCDEKHYRIGLRTIELRREPDEWGTSFEFVVNGVPVFAKGSNWIPADSFPRRITDDQLEHLIRSAAGSHQNMLRVWGGGLFEDERFYDLCDQYGILIWQDHIFSCSIYPLDEQPFLENLEHEVRDNVTRLRHRACLALWCGNNEMEWGWEYWGWAPLFDHEEEAFFADLVRRKPFLRPYVSIGGRTSPPADWEALRSAYEKYFFTTLPHWIGELDPDTPYWPSSPSSNIPFFDVNSERQGDMHYWGVWHEREPFTAYRALYPRFMSEFGFQSLPPMETIKAFADPSDWNMTSYIMEYHQRGNHGNGLIIAQMTANYRMPKDFESLVYMSLVQQAEGIRCGVEHWRRHRDRVAGTLYWQLNDCWPAASWSSIDYFGRWKALHYAAKRFYAPVLLSIEDQGARMGIHVTNDRREPFEGIVRWTLETVAGEVVDRGECPITVDPTSSLHVETLDFADRLDEAARRETVLVCELLQGEERLSMAVVPFVPNKHLALVDPALAGEATVWGDQVVIVVSAKTLARFVEVSIDGADVIFSDNYFDLPAGRTLNITCPLPDGWEADQLRRALRVRSLYEAFG